MHTTDWYAPNIDPIRIGYYEMINESTGLIFRPWYSGSMWFRDLRGPAVPLLRIWPWRGLTLEAYIADLEPYGAQLAGRHCPLDGGVE